MWKGNHNSLTRFCAVGGINTAIDFTVFALLFYGVGARVMVSHVAAFCLASLNSYLLNKFWTFGDSSPHRAKQVVLFLAVCVSGLALSSLTIYVLCFYMPEILAKVCAIAVSLVWGYLGNRFFVFSLRKYTS